MFDSIAFCFKLASSMSSLNSEDTDTKDKNNNRNIRIKKIKKTNQIKSKMAVCIYATSNWIHFVFHSININESTKSVGRIHFEYKTAAILKFNRSVITNTWYRFFFSLIFLSFFSHCQCGCRCFLLHLIFFFISGNYHYQLSLSTCFNIIFFLLSLFASMRFLSRFSMGFWIASLCHAFINANANFLWGNAIT